MTARSLDRIRSLAQDNAATCVKAPQPDTQSRALVDQAVAFRRCALYRNAFRGAAVSYPAALLEFDAVATWIRRHGVPVDVTTAGEFGRAVAVGINPMRIVMHCGDGHAALIRRAVDARVGRFVVSSTEQIAVLAGNAERIQRVVIDAKDETVTGLASEVLAHGPLDLVGLHCSLDDPDDPIGVLKLRRAIQDMSRIRRERGVILACVSAGDMDVGNWGHQPHLLRRVAEAIAEVVGDACAQYRHPRPAVTISPERAALLPT